MSDSSHNDQTVPSAGPGDPDKTTLAHVESPGIVPDGASASEACATGAEIASAAPAEGTHEQPKHVETPAAGRSGTALILAPLRPKAEAPEPASEPAPAKAAPRFRMRSLAAMVAAAATVGGIAGALATSGVSYMMASPAAAPVHDATLSEALGRVDHQLSVLKTGVEGAAKTTNQQIAKISDRLDRGEKSQAEAGAKLAKAIESIDRVERRVAAAPGGDVTGTVGEPHQALAPGPNAAAPEVKHLPPATVIDGWVVRDVYNGSAMIQSRAGIIQVIPGDNLPGLGRIEQVRRQEGRWVVVTSRGLIVSR
jgi:hypothetical protein